MKILITGICGFTGSTLARAFKEYFTRLFGGGSAELVLTEPENLITTGIDIIAHPPGKRRQPLGLLSGGERALTAGPVADGPEARPR